MEETKRKLYVEPSGFWTEASMLFMILAMIFRVIGSIGRWDDMNYLITLVVLPVFCGLMFLLSLLFFGKRAFWTSVVPVVIGVVFFIFQIMTVEDNLMKVGLISLCVVVAVLYAMTFSHPGLKWLLALFLLGVFVYLLVVKDLPRLMDQERTVGFLEGMQEMSVLGIILSLFCVSLAMRMTRKAPEEALPPEEEEPQETLEVPETEIPAETPAAPEVVLPDETPASAEEPVPTDAPAPTEEPAEPEAPAKPKKLSWREKRQARKEKNDPEPPAKEEEELFPFPIPEPGAEPDLYPETEEPVGGTTWEVSYEEPSYDAADQTDDDPEQFEYPEPMDDSYPKSSDYEAPVYPPELDFGEDPEPDVSEPTDYTPVEEVPITRKTPFAEPAEIYPLEEPAEDEPGPTAP